MATRRKYRRRGRRRVAPSTSIAGYTRAINLAGNTAASGATTLVTVDVPDVENFLDIQGGSVQATPTQNRKLIGVTGQAMFTAALAADRLVMAQFCLWAHPAHEDWPSVADYDPFNAGPDDTSNAYEGMLAPRAFCRRTFVLNTPASGVAETISQQHMIRSKTERLLRPGWKLTAGLYLRGSNASIAVKHSSLLRYVVAG